MLSLTWRNISESKQIRLMVTSLQRSLEDLLLFMVIVFLSLYGLIQFASNSFGYASTQTADFRSSAVSLFKLFVGHGLGDFYRMAIKVDWVNAHLFIFAFIVVLNMYISIAIVIVSRHYEKTVLGQDTTMDVDIM